MLVGISSTIVWNVHLRGIVWVRSQCVDQTSQFRSDMCEHTMPATVQVRDGTETGVTEAALGLQLK